MYNPLIEAIHQARQSAQQLCITGHGSKEKWLPTPTDLKKIQVKQQGIVDYQPEELVITAHAGTPVADIVGALNERNQQFGFEPQQFSKPALMGTFGNDWFWFFWT